MNDDFAVLIPTHGRANNVITIGTLRKAGYTGKIYLVIDNEDEQADEYRKLQCSGVIVFDKSEEMKHTDTGDNFKDHRLVVYARNKMHDIARDLGLKYFLVLDDDYKGLDFRYEEKGKLKAKRVKHADRMFETFCRWLDESGAITVCFAQGGDFIGGVNGGVYKKRVLRKAMNSFFCMTDRPFKFYGSTNEDVNMYVTNGMRGNLCFTVVDICVIQPQTQKNAGGLTDIYLANGTYVKSFYSVMYEPSCVTVQMMGQKHYRIHHKITWDNCCPKILNEQWKK